MSRTFRLKAEAEAWSRDQESRIDKGETPLGRAPESRETLADLIDLHFADLLCRDVQPTAFERFRSKQEDRDRARC